MTIRTPTGFDFEDFEDWLWVDDIPVMEEDPEPETEGEDVQVHPDYLPLIKLSFPGDDNERPS